MTDSVLSLDLSQLEIMSQKVQYIATGKQDKHVLFTMEYKVTYAPLRLTIYYSVDDFHSYSTASFPTKDVKASRRYRPVGLHTATN